MHGEHSLDPVPFAKRPGMQSEHLVIPNALENVPSGHRWHCSIRVSFAKVPGRHGVQCSLLAVELRVLARDIANVPMGHSEHWWLVLAFE